MPSPPPKPINGPFYVYELVDPRDGAVFWIGIGTGQRWQKSACLGPSILSPAKYRRIESINAAGMRPISRIHSDYRSRAESATAERYLLTTTPGLTNINGRALGTPPHPTPAWSNGLLSVGA